LGSRDQKKDGRRTGTSMIRMEKKRLLGELKKKMPGKRGGRSEPRTDKGGTSMEEEQTAREADPSLGIWNVKHLERKHRVNCRGTGKIRI